MFSVNKIVCSGLNRLLVSSNFATLNQLSCRNNYRRAALPFKSKKRFGAGLVGAGCFLLGTALGFKYKKLILSKYESLLSWLDSFEPPSVFAAVNLRDEYNKLADVLENKSLGIVAIDSWLTENDNRRLYDYGIGFVDQASELVITNEGFISFDQEKIFQVIFEDGTAHHAKVVSLDNHSDLAALRLCNDKGEVREKGGIPTVKLSTSEPRLGDKLVAVVMKDKDSDPSVYKVFSGCLANLRKKKDDNPLQMTTHLVDGAYGGPVLNLDGEVVGVVSLKYHSGATLSLPYNCVKKFIDRSLEHEKTVLKKETDIRRKILEDKKLEEERQRKEMEEIIEARQKMAEELEKDQ